MCHPNEISSHFATYPFVVTKESDMNKEQFVNEILKAYESLKQEGDNVSYKQ